MSVDEISDVKILEDARVIARLVRNDTEMLKGATKKKLITGKENSEEVIEDQLPEIVLGNR